MERKERNLIIGVILIALAIVIYFKKEIFLAIPMFLLMLIFGGNSPGTFEVDSINEVGAPLSINEVWNEEGIFEVKINEIKEIPIDSLRVGDDEVQRDYTLFDWKIKSYKGRRITRAVEVIFEFKNINFTGIGKNEGLHFVVKGYGYDKDGQSVKDASQGYGYDKDGAFIKSFDSLGRNDDQFGWDGVYRKGMISTHNRLILLIEDHTSRIELEFESFSGTDGHFYKKYFYYELPESDIEGL